MLEESHVVLDEDDWPPSAPSQGHIVIVFVNVLVTVISSQAFHDPAFTEEQAASRKRMDDRGAMMLKTCGQ